MKKPKQKILEILNKSGIRDASFCAFLPLLPYLIECRAKHRLPENSKTVITCIFPYKVKEQKPKNISRYSAVPDYHIVISKYLSVAVKELKREFPENSFEFFADNSPIPEVKAAALSGLGVVGDNGLLINGKYGSFVFIGEIVTDLGIETTEHSGECLHCGRCKNACPKNDGIDCLSKITQKKSDLDEKEISAIRKFNSVWGCDICSDVCPLNQNKQFTYIKEFIEDYRDEYKENEDISGRAFEWRGEKVIKRNFKL